MSPLKAESFFRWQQKKSKRLKAQEGFDGQLTVLKMEGATWKGPESRLEELRVTPDQQPARKQGLQIYKCKEL